MKLNTFPNLPRDLLNCNATANGYPPNEWDISISRRTYYLYLIKHHPPYPVWITVNPYPVLTPLNPNPRVTLGDNLNIVIEDDGPVTALKIYNLQYHLLRAANSQPINAAVNSCQGSRAFENLKLNPRGHTNIQAFDRRTLVKFTHHMDAIHHIIQHHLFNPDNFKIRTSCKTITVAEYIRYANTTLPHRQGNSRSEWNMRHDVHRELTLRKKAILGDRKLLLGYRHAGYRSDSTLRVY